MKLFKLSSKQYLPIGISEAWEFISNPANLKVITPEHMGFEIIDGADRKMFPGQIIQYNVKPFPGYSTKWVTEITHVKQGSYFVDEQRFGPYSLWHHKHFINEIAGGVEMQDIIHYKLPFGILGQIAHPILVKKQLEQIFKHREQKLNILFGNLPEMKNTLEFKTL